MPSPEKFNDILKKFGVDEETIALVNEGYDGITSKTKKTECGKYFARSLKILKEQIGVEKTHDIYEANACCLSGSRLKASKQFAKDHAELTPEKRLALLGEVPYMGQCPDAVIDENNMFTVETLKYFEDGKYKCGCPNYKVMPENPIDKDYCYCCAGHFKFHYEIMLGVNLRVVEIVGSPLDSDGKNPCIMKFQII